MLSRWNVRGDSNTYAIMWIGSAIAVIIMAVWFSQRIYPISNEIAAMSSDLSIISKNVNQACSSDLYRNEFNPKLSHGKLFVNKNVLCINTTKFSRCKNVFCGMGAVIDIDLGKITYIVIEKNSTFSIYGK